MRTHRTVVVVGGILAAGVLVAATTRPARAERDLVSPNLAEVVTASFFGTEGTEWLAAGGFLADGTVLVAGVTLEADLALRGTEAVVLGRDAPPLEPVTAWELLGEKDTGKVAVPELEVGGLGDVPSLEDEGFSLDEPPTEEELKRRAEETRARLRAWPRRFQWSEAGEDIESQTMYVKLNWMQPEATAFFAVCSPDLKTVHRLTRLPRGAGSVTSVAVAADGAVYVAGAAGDRIANLSDQAKTETVPDPKGVSEGTFGCRRTYLARLSPDVSKVVWVRVLEGWSIAPRLRVLRDGTISMHGPGLRSYTPQGELVRSVSIQNTRVVSGLDVSPVDGAFTRVGDWMSGTGREPYRNPRLYVYRPDGAEWMHLYGWRGPFVGVDHLRLVADSAVRRSAYDPEGNLTVSTWSHGGNNVCFRYPYDIERVVPNRLGHRPMETCASVIKMGPDHNVVASTRWLNAAFIRDLVCAVDGSIVLVGSCGRTVPLPNSLTEPRAGTGLYVIDPNLTAYRFTSVMPACGTRVVVGGCTEMPNAWGFATGRIKGRPMLLCLSGAVRQEQTKGETVAPPLGSPVQPTYGGGLMDGYVVLLDLTAEKPWPPYVEPEHPAREPKPYEGPLAWPAEGQVFRLGTESYVTVKATFRDEADDLWPTFYQGRGVEGGTFAYGTETAAAEFALDCPTVIQEAGDQSRRVMGELVTFTVTEGVDRKGRPRTFADLDNKAKLVVTGLGPWTPAEQPSRYGRVMCPVAEAPLEGTLQVGPRAVPLAGATCRARFVIPKDVDPARPETRPNRALLTARFTAPGAALGLTGRLAREAIRVQFTFSAASPVDYTAQREAEKVDLPDLELPDTLPGRALP